MSCLIWTVPSRILDLIPHDTEWDIQSLPDKVSPGNALGDGMQTREEPKKALCREDHHRRV